MKLSEDGKTLLSVKHSDLDREGCFKVPASVTQIGDDAFRGCSSLTTITLPAGVTQIGTRAFLGCSILTTITLPAGVTQIGDSAFKGCSSLTTLMLPAGVTQIGDSAFSGCSSLATITLPAGVTQIGDYAFSGCSSLGTITLPDTVTQIGNDAFSGCSSLATITLPAGVTQIGTSAFWGCSSLATITLPAGVTQIGDDAFRGCSSLTTITLPAGVTQIGNLAFYGCWRLTAITLPAGVTQIGEQAFGRCSSLTTLTLPDSVTHIGDYAFDGYSSLSRIVINSDDERKVARIRDLLPDAWKSIVISKTVYQIQEQALYDLILGNRWLSTVYGTALEQDVFSVIHEHKGNRLSEAYYAIEKEVLAIPFPQNEGAYEGYKHQLQEVIHNTALLNEIKSRFLCIRKLEQYVEIAEDSLKQKGVDISFFGQSPPYTDKQQTIIDRLKAVKDVISKLRAGEKLSLSDKEARLFEGKVLSILKESKQIEPLDEKQSTPHLKK